MKRYTLPTEEALVAEFVQGQVVVYTLYENCEVIERDPMLHVPWTDFVNMLKERERYSVRIGGVHKERFTRGGRNLGEILGESFFQALEEMSEEDREQLLLDVCEQ